MAGARSARGALRDARRASPQELREARGSLICAALANGGKTLAESDPEVSEAVDFVEFYRARRAGFFELPAVAGAAARAWSVVVPPWNFPIAIPCGGVAAALAAGNTRHPQAGDAIRARGVGALPVLLARRGSRAAALQFLPCPGSGAGQRSSRIPRVDAVILTGGTDTALHLLSAQPGAAALRRDRRQERHRSSPRSPIASRRSSTCCTPPSATAGRSAPPLRCCCSRRKSTTIRTSSELLVDAARSWPVGSAWDLPTRLGPAHPPAARRARAALTTLEPGESWALEPRQLGDNPHLWSPGVK